MTVNHCNSDFRFEKYSVESFTTKTKNFTRFGVTEMEKKRVTREDSEFFFGNQKFGRKNSETQKKANRNSEMSKIRRSKIQKTDSGKNKNKKLFLRGDITIIQLKHN